MITCPHCEKSIGHVEVQDVQVGAPMQQVYAGCAYLCPLCKKFLSVGLDPLVLGNGIVDKLNARIEKLFQKHLPR